MVRSRSSVEGSGASSHANIRLGAERLHDYFLDVAVLLVGRMNGQQRVHALFGSFADSDQNAGSESHR